MPFDPDEYNRVKASLGIAPTPTPAPTPPSAPLPGGFDPAEYAKVKAQMAAPPDAQARPGLVGRAVDFARRAFMPEAKPENRNIVQNLGNEVGDVVTGGAHLIGQGLVEGGKMLKDVATSVPDIAIAPTPASIMASPAGKRVSSLPQDVETAFSPEGRKLAMDELIKPAVEQSAKSFGFSKDQYDKYKFNLHTPIQALHDHPFGTLIDWSTAYDLLGAGVRGGANAVAKAAELAGKEGVSDSIEKALSLTREALPVSKNIEVAREYAKNPLTKFVFQKPFDKLMDNPALQEFVSQSPVLKYLAPMPALTPEARAGRVAGRVMQDAQDEFYRLRNERMIEVQNQFAKLSPEEQRDFIPIVQGRAMPLYQSPKFKEVYDWYKSTVADEQAKFNLPDETVKRVAFQPLAVSQGLLSPDDYKLALRGDEDAIAKVAKVTNDLAESRVRVQTDAMRQFLYGNRPGRPTSEMIKTAQELAEATAPDPLYFPSVFENKIKLSDFLPNKFMQKFRPGFLKGRTGVFGFIENDPATAFAIHQSQVERYLQNEHLINSVTEKFAVPLDKASDLKPGWKPFAPNGYMGFYRGVMPLQEAFLRGVGMGQDIDEAFTSALKQVIPDMIKDKTFVGVRKPKLFQIPADVTRKMQDVINPSFKMPELFKLVYDKPLQAFKFSVLAMSPRWIVNNTVGNIVTTMAGRVSPESFLKATDPEMLKLIPPEVASGGFRRAEFPGLKRILNPETGMADKVTGFFSGSLPTEGVLHDVQNLVSRPVKAVGKFADTVFEANSKIEDLFRNATFIDKTTKAAVEQIAKKTSTGIFDMKAGLDRFLQRGNFAESNVAKVAKEMLQNPAFKDQMVGKVNDILNDYSHMSKFERAIVRRVVPFWSWWKFVNVLFWTMPMKDPLMAQAIKHLGMAGMDIAKDEWKANGLNIKEIPEWMQGNVVLGKTPDGKMLDMLNTKSLNPLSTAAEWPGLAPQLKLFIERRTGKQFPSGAPFTHPNEIEVNGVVVRKEGQNFERIEHPTPPPLSAHILRELPQVQIAEALAMPYKKYSGEGLFSGNILTKRGRPVPLDPAMKIGSILGMPMSQTDYRTLRLAPLNINRAKNKIELNLERSRRANEQIRLGEGE